MTAPQQWTRELALLDELHEIMGPTDDAGEIGARQLLNDMMHDVEHTLRPDQATLASDDRLRLEQAYAQLRPAFEQIAKAIEPLRAADTARFKTCFISLYQLMIGAFHAGAFCVVSASVRDHLREPLKTGGARGGAQSGITRRAKSDRSWRAESKKAIIADRAKNPENSQSTVANNVIAGWKKERPPGYKALVDLIREMEKAGEIQKRRALRALKPLLVVP